MKDFKNCNITNKTKECNYEKQVMKIELKDNK